jgi:hypothetical protein
MTAAVLPLPAQAYVYVIGTSAGPKKVGVAEDITQRLTRLQTGNPAPLKCYHSRSVPKCIAAQVERAAHKLLSTKRVSGEWFDVELDEAKVAIDLAIAEADEKVLEALQTGMGYAGSLTGIQLKAGRILARWSVKDLAERSGIDVKDIQRIEKDKVPVGNATTKTVEGIQRALEGAGIVFLPDGYGVTKRQP